MANVKVAVRVRPLSKRENAEGSNVIVNIDDKIISIRNVKLDNRPDGPGDTRERNIEFTFDYCYWSLDPDSTNYSSQEMVYQDLGTSVLSGAIKGYNVCLFAYGQTGSGKTYTMMGTPASIGLTPRICKGLFSMLDNYQEVSASSRVEVSFLEIYTERVRDLLKRSDGNKPCTLRVREHPDTGPYVEGLSQHVVSDYNQVVELLEEGIANRITAATHVHDASSRSHAIFTIHYTQAIMENNLPSEIVSKINLVDLAGSERADPNYCKDRIIEGSNINKSLVTLGIVISTLAQNSQMFSSCQSINSILSEGDTSNTGSHSSGNSRNSRRQYYIPYRDSVLTWLLKDSLGGNSKTIMIATISPASTSYGESVSTLRYAAHAKNIVNKPRVNEDANVKLIRELREEIDRLKAMLMNFELRNFSPSFNDDKDGNLAEMLLQNELKIEQVTKAWTNRWKDTKAIMEEYNVDINRGKTGLIVASQLPHLIAVDDDILRTEVVLYHLREGTTNIAGIDAEGEQDIILQGPCVKGQHCVIHNENGVVTLEPIGGTQCTVNGLDVINSCCLSQGAVIVMGKFHKFRFNHPTEAAKLRQRRLSTTTVSLGSSITSCEDLYLDGEFNFSPPYVVSPLPQASLEYDKERDEENHLHEIRRQLIELREQYQSKQLEHEEYKQKLKDLEVFYKEQIQQQQRYVEEFRLHIQAAQSLAQQELEDDQEQLNQQIKENQLCLANEERRLVSLEQQQRDLGVQTESPSFFECGVQVPVETDEIPSIEQNRKHLMQLELLQKHSLRKAERSISKKKVKFQLERIAEKHKLLEAKQNLRELEAASLLNEHQTKLDKTTTVQTASNSGATCWRKSRSPGFFRQRRHSLSVPLVRRHSDTNNLVSRLYPQNVPVYSNFLKRKTSDLPTSSQTKNPSTLQESFAVESVSQMALPVFKKQLLKRGNAIILPVRGQLKKKEIAAVNETNMDPQQSERSCISTSKEQAKLNVSNIPTSNPRAKAKQSNIYISEDIKCSPSCFISESNAVESKSIKSYFGWENSTNKLSETRNQGVRQDLKRKYSMYASRNIPTVVCKKPHFGDFSGGRRIYKGLPSFHLSEQTERRLFVSSLTDLNKLSESVCLAHSWRRWHSAEILNTGITEVVTNGFGGWLEVAQCDGGEVSDNDSVCSLDSLSSSYVNVLTMRLKQEELEGQFRHSEDDGQSDDSQLSQDSLTKGKATVGKSVKSKDSDLNSQIMSNFKMTRCRLGMVGKSLSLDSLADVEGVEIDNFFIMDSGGVTQSDEMPAEVYWKLNSSCTESDRNKDQHQTTVSFSEKQSLEDLKQSQGELFYVDSNTELKPVHFKGQVPSLDSEGNILSENLESSLNATAESMIMTDVWFSCKSSSRCSGPHSGINSPNNALDFDMIPQYGNMESDPESDYIQTVRSFDPLQKIQQDDSFDLHKTSAMIPPEKEHPQHAKNTEAKLDEKMNSVQTKGFSSNTSKTDGLTMEDGRFTEISSDQSMPCGTKVLGSLEAEGITASATKTITMSTLPGLRPQSCSQIESKKLDLFGHHSAGLKLTASGADGKLAQDVTGTEPIEAIAAKLDIDCVISSGTEIMKRTQRESKEKEINHISFQLRLSEVNKCKRFDAHGNTVSGVEVHKAEKIIHQLVPEAEQLVSDKQSHKTESEICSTDSAAVILDTSELIGRIPLQTKVLEVLNQYSSTLVEKAAPSTLNRKQNVSSSTYSSDSLAKESYLLNECLTLNAAPSFIQKKLKPALKLNAAPNQSNCVLTLMKDSTCQSQKSNEGDKPDLQPAMMDGKNVEDAAIKDNPNFMKKPPILIEKVKKQVNLSNNDSGYTSAEPLLEVANIQEAPQMQIESGNKLGELRRLNDEHFCMKNSTVSENIDNSLSQRQSAVADVVHYEEPITKDQIGKKELCKVPDIQNHLLIHKTIVVGDLQDQLQNKNMYSEEKPALDSTIYKEHISESNNQELVVGSNMRVSSGFQQGIEYLAELRQTFPAKSSVLLRPCLKETEKLNSTIEDESKHSSSIETISEIGNATKTTELIIPEMAIDGININTEISASGTRVGRSVSDLKKRDAGIDAEIMEFVGDRRNQSKRFKNSNEPTTCTSQDSFNVEKEACEGIISEGTLKEYNEVWYNSVQADECYFDHNITTDSTMETVEMADTKVFVESNVCELSSKWNIGTKETFNVFSIEIDNAVNVTIGGCTESDQRIATSQSVERNNSVCHGLDQSKLKEDNVTCCAREKVHNHSGAIDNYFQAMSSVACRYNASETDVETRTVSINLLTESDMRFLSTLQQISGMCMTKNGNNAILFGNVGASEKLNKTLSAKAGTARNGTAKLGTAKLCEDIFEYHLQKMHTAESIGENNKYISGTNKEMSQLCDWAYAEIGATGDASIRANEMISASRDISFSSSDAARDNQMIAEFTERNLMKHKNSGKSNPVKISNMEKISDQISKIAHGYEMGSDFTGNKVKGKNKILGYIGQDVYRTYPESSQDFTAVELVQTGDPANHEFKTKSNSFVRFKVASTIESATYDPSANGDCFDEFTKTSECPCRVSSEVSETKSKTYKNPTKAISNLETGSRSESSEKTSNTRALLIGRVDKKNTNTDDMHVNTDIISHPHCSDHSSSVPLGGIEISNQIVLNDSEISQTEQDTISGISVCRDNQKIQSFNASISMAHEIRELPQENATPSTTEHEDVELQKDDSCTLVIPTSILGCILVSDDDKQEKDPHAKEESIFSTMQQREFFERIQYQGGVEHTSAAQCKMYEVPKELQQQSCDNDQNRLLSAGRLKNYGITDQHHKKMEQHKTLPQKNDSSAGDSATHNFSLSEILSPSDTGFLSSNNQMCELEGGNILQQLAANTVTDSADCFKDTVYHQVAESTLNVDGMIMPYTAENIQETVMSGVMNSTVQWQSENTALSQSVFELGIQETIDENIDDYQGISATYWKDSQIPSERSVGAQSYLDVTLKEVIGRNIMWCQIDGETVSDVNDFSPDIPKSKSKIQPKWESFAEDQSTNQGIDLCCNQLPQKTSEEGGEHSAKLISETADATGVLDQERSNIFKDIQSALNLANQNINCLSSLVNDDRLAQSFQNAVSIGTKWVYQQTDPTNRKLQKYNVSEEQAKCCRKLSLQHFPQFNAKPELSQTNSFSCKHMGTQINRQVSDKIALLKHQDKELKSEQKLVHEPQQIQTKIAKHSVHNKLMELESALSPELPNYEKSKEQDRLQQMVPENPPSSKSIVGTGLHIPKETEHSVLQVSNSTCVNTLTQENFTDLYSHNTQAGLCCRREMDYAEGSTDGDCMEIVASIPADNLLQMNVKPRERTMVIDGDKKHGEESALAAGINSMDAENKKNIYILFGSNRSFTVKQDSCGEFQSLLKLHPEIFKEGLVYCENIPFIDPHNENQVKEKSTSINFKLQSVPETNEVQMRIQQITGSERMPEIHQIESQMELPCPDKEAGKQLLSSIQNTRNESVTSINLHHEARLQTRYLHDAPEITEAYNERVFPSNGSDDLPVTQMDEPQNKKPGESDSQSIESNKCIEILKLTNSTGSILGQDSVSSSAAMRIKFQRLNKLKPKPTTDGTTGSSSSIQEKNPEFVSLKEIQPSRQPTSTFQYREPQITNCSKLEGNDEFGPQLLSPRMSRQAVAMSSCSVDIITEVPREHTLGMILPTEYLAQLNLNIEQQPPHGEEVTNQREPDGEWNTDNLRCGESEPSVQAKLVRECVSNNSDALFCDGVHHFRSTLPSWNKTQENESSTKESGDSDNASVSTNHNSCSKKLGDDQSLIEQKFHEKKEPMHFSFSDINPYVHQWQCDELSRSNGKRYAFGSASDISNVQSNHNTHHNAMRCSSVDYGLNVLNSPFNSHLSCYANTRSISGTSSSGADYHGEDGSAESTETGYPDSKNLNESSCQMSCNLSIATSWIKEHAVSSTGLENGTLQLDEIVLLYSSQDESSGKSTSEGTLKFTCDQETQTVGGIRHRKLPKPHKSFTETPAQMPVEQGTWASLQNLSINLSQLLHNTSELLDSIHSNPDQNLDQSKKQKTDSYTQTAVDVAIQTEMLDHEIDNENHENQATRRKDKQRLPEVNITVKVIGSDVNMSQEKTGITLTLQERQQNISAKMTSMPDLNAHHSSFNSSLCSPSSSKDGNSFRASTPSLIDSQKLSLKSSPKYSLFSPAVSPVGLPSQPPIHPHNTSVNCFGSHFSKVESSHPCLCRDTSIESSVKDPAVNVKLAILVDRASSPIQTFEARAENHRSHSKSFIGVQDRGSQILLSSEDWQRKQRPASWYGFYKEQKEVNLTHLKSNDVENEQKGNGAMSFGCSNELSKFTFDNLSRAAKLESEAQCQDKPNSSFVRSKATKSQKDFLKMPMVTSKPKYKWQCDVGNREQEAIQHGYAQIETKSQLVFQEVEQPFTESIDERKHVICSASQAACQNTPRTLSEISAGTTSESRRSFHRSASLCGSMVSAQLGQLSENNQFGTESNEQKDESVENLAQNDSTWCNSGASCSPCMEIEMAMNSANEDAQSIVLSECNTEVLLNEIPSLICCSKPQVSGEANCRGPEDLPLHNKFCNWSGVFHSPPSVGSITTVTTSSCAQTEETQTKDYVAHRTGSKSEQREERLKEIEKLRTERAQIMSGLHLNLNQHQLSVELTEAKLNYGCGETDTLLKLLQSGTADDLNTPIKQQLYDRHMKSIETFRKEREEKLQKFRRTRSLSPQKQLILRHQKECSQQELPSKRRDYLQKLRKDIVKNTRALPLIKSEAETPSEIEYLLRDYQKARDETKAEIARARDRLRERAEKEKCRLQKQISQLLKDEERRKNMVSRSSLCTGSNLSLSSNPTSGYSSSNTVSPDISSKELKKMKSAAYQMVNRGRKASLNSQLYSSESLSSINTEAFLGTTKDHSVSTQPLDGSSPTGSLCSLKHYQDLATRTTASFKAEVMVASISDLGNLLNGKAAAGWKYHSSEKGILMYYKKYASATKHGFMGVGVIEKPLHCVWCMVKDHSKRQLYDKTIKTVQVHRQLGGGIQLVYLVNNTSVCYLNQPRDFCCISVEAKEEQQYIVAIQSIYEESMPRPVNDIVRGEILPSGWILQPDVQNGKEITKVIYMIQVDLGAPALPSRLLASVVKRQPLCIATLASFLSC